MNGSGKTYRIRRSFLVPLAVDVLLLFALLVISLTYKGSGTERIFLASLSLFSLPILAEAALRKVIVSEGGVALKKLGKLRELLWSDITHVGCLKVRSRVYILLTTKKGFHIISNAYDSFAALVGDIVGHLDAEKIEIEAEAKEQIDNPTRNSSDLMAAWIAAVVLAAIIYVKFIP
ncbi:MAG TPA: hypothetical protein PK175_01575 [Syntrophales bacterium]|jgi:hypothetical protein|nr:hypothetical protein [Syntrophales bacterium]HON22321.1 hypothetical protein [Syntrophales bacterium]HOU76764.1 hypothetical protein [Syntrophales bacterium]HPC31887.1 hypothetical protein [Syntrophales bacterium]HQG33549.1 hypothetical protein [Syntrophales bacterium]